MKFVVAGLGSIGRRHMRNLIAHGEKDLILYRTRKSTMPEEDLQGFPVETDLAAALAYHPDGVIVSNPTAMHLDVAIPAAKQGAAILLEKPISHNMDRVSELAAAAKKSGAKILVGFQYRFHPNLQKAKQLISQGAIGRPVSFKVNWGEFLPGWHPWEDHRQSYAARQDLGGGVVLTLCHPLDYLRWFFGEVGALWAFTSVVPELESAVDAVAEIGLRMTEGISGTIHLDYIQRPGSHTLEITGTQGMLRWDNGTSVLKLYRSDDSSWQDFNAPDGFERNCLFMDETAAFLKLIRGEIESPCTLEDGIRALELTLAVHTSARDGIFQKW
jgi:predicted dehydrogenase